MFRKFLFVFFISEELLLLLLFVDVGIRVLLYIVLFVIDLDWELLGVL